MTSTYEKIATTTLGSASNTVTFSSIPATYTDLIVQGSLSPVSSVATSFVRFNGDTGNNYSTTFLENAASTRTTNAPSAFFSYTGATNQQAYTIQIQNYSNATTYKTFLARAGDKATAVYATVGLWRNTNAITSVTVLGDINFAIGSTFTLYGIKAE
jgi:hypothetical protein